MKRLSEGIGSTPRLASPGQAPLVYGAPDLPGIAGSGEKQQSMLMDYYRTLSRHRVLILGLAFLGLAGSLIFHLTTLPLYRARTSVEIQNLNGDFMNIRSVDPTEAVTTGETNIQTQMKLLESESLLARVNQRLSAEAHPPFLAQNDMLSKLRRLLRIDNGSQVSFDALLDQTAGSVRVKQLSATRIIEITCDSWDPKFAAHFCDTLVNEFQNEDLESRGSQAKRTSDWLMRQASDIRQKAEDAQQRLVAATGGNGLVLSQETDTVGEDRLRQMQAELVKAQADRMEKEAQVSVIRSTSIQDLPGGLDSPAFAAAKARVADLEAKVAALVPPLTEANPKVIHLRAEIKEAQEDVQRERQASIQHLQSEYAAARHHEDLLARAYREQESNVSSDLQKGSQVNLLRREVDSEQQLYQTLLQKAKEAGFASALQASTIRVVDDARPPRFAFYPRRISSGTTCFILGALLGIAIAFFRDRNTTVVREPGEIKKFLHMEELGVIPSPTKEKLYLPRQHGGPIFDLHDDFSSAALQTARWKDDFSLVAEAYRNVTLSILLAGRNKQARIYVVSSPSAGEGKTTVTSNIAVALSKSKMKVVVIDADLRKPSLHRAFCVSNTFGLRNILRGEVDIDRFNVAEVCKPTSFPTMWVIPSGEGKEQAAELLHSPRFGDLLARLSRAFDVILVDTPPILHMADARIVARHAHGAILIVRSGVTTREQALHARDVLDRDRVPVMGTILNDFNPAKAGQPGYYKSYYAYEKQSKSEENQLVNS
ncbi:GumC family protein [Silvibacterium sp.]|uniref:GumC family protein n=1 Tax=Silvibacterium sp. TaxID=1964179 RepID=UPI0039E2EE1C